MSEKSIVLIDAENVLKSWQHHCKDNKLDDRVDYVKLRDKLSEGTNLLRAYFYDGVPETPTAKKKSFLNALRRNGIQTRTRILKNRHFICKECEATQARQIQKGVDVCLATDILRHSWQGSCDICIVVSGDADYKDAMELVKDKGTKVWVASFSNNLSKEISMTADKIIRLEDIFDDIKMKSG